MQIKTLSIQNFRNHKKASFAFSHETIIIGKNTAGKTNILEALYLLSHGKSFKAEKEINIITTDKEFARIEGEIRDEEDEKIRLTVILALREKRFTKKFMVNNVTRRQIDFTSNFNTVLFTPEDLDIITDSPSTRRSYINAILSQSSREYRVTLVNYEKALRRRNKMLWLEREGKKSFGVAEFEYWDNLLIENGNFITLAREEFIGFVNQSEKKIFSFEIFYDKSTISRARLDKYHDAERASAQTLVGPNRDDFLFQFETTKKSLSEFGSRGEQRLTIFQVKLLETLFLIYKTEKTPVLLLDDIFSELDDENIQKVLDLLPEQQTIITTTHREFIPKKMLKKEDVKIIEL